MQRLGYALITLATVACAPESDASQTGRTGTHIGLSGSFPVHTRIGGTVTELTGINSSQASAAGAVTTADAQEFCARDPGGVTIEYGGRLTIEQCVASTLREYSRVYRISADCNQMRINSTEGVFELYFPDNMDLPPRWMDSSGDTLDWSSASGAFTISAQFRLLCPQQAADAGLED